MINSNTETLSRNTILTVQDVAELLKVCPRTVLNMAKRGDIPASRIGHLWRFDEQAIHQWLLQKAPQSREEKKISNVAMLPRSIIEFLNPELVRFEKSVSGAREVLEDLASLAVRSGEPIDYSQLLHSLEDREKIFPTALDIGVAFPHPRRPIPGLGAPILSTLVVESGVEFGAPEAGKTFVFMLFCAPNDAMHVRVLARLAQIFHNQKRLISRIKHIANPEDIIRELLRAEQDRVKKK